MSQEFTIETAAGVRNAKPSEVRKVFAMSAKPGMISFASGMPELSSLPMDSLADITEDLMRNRGMEVMQYGASTTARITSRPRSSTHEARGASRTPSQRTSLSPPVRSAVWTS